MYQIKLISEEEIIKFWSEHLWVGREDIKSHSSIVYNSQPFLYDLRYYKSKLSCIGIYDDDKLIGVNSGFKTDDKYRSRGLFVLEEYRGEGFGVALLEATIKIAKYEGFDNVWSIPKKTALKTYLSVGFQQTSDYFKTDTSEANCYVALRRQKMDS